MATRGLVINRWVNTIPIKQLEAKQAKIMLRYATEVKEEAQRLAVKRVPDSMAKGVKTRRLVSAIKIDGPYEENRTTRIGIYVDEDETIAERDETGSSYAKFQEFGTGMHGPKGHMIVPKKRKWMVWDQPNYPYRGKRDKVIARLTSFKTVRHKGRTHKENRVYTIFARELKGVRPKLYMRGARQNKIIKSKYERELASLYRTQIVSLVSVTSSALRAFMR